MLNSYNATISTANSDVTLFTVASGKEALIIGVKIYGGANGAKVTMTKNNGSSNVFTEKYTVGANDMLCIDTKSAFPAGYSYKVQADATGVMVDVCADTVGA